MGHDCRKCHHVCSHRQAEPEPQSEPQSQSLGMKIATRIVALVFFIPILLWRILIIAKMRKRAIEMRNQFVELVNKSKKSK